MGYIGSPTPLYTCIEFGSVFPIVKDRQQLESYTLSSLPLDLSFSLSLFLSLSLTLSLYPVVIEDGQRKAKGRYSRIAE